MYPFVRDAILKAYGAKEGEKPLAVMTLSGFIAGILGSMPPGCQAYQVKTLAQAEAGMVNSEGILTTGSRAGEKPQYVPFLTGMNKLRLEGNLFRGIGALLTRGSFLAAGT
jgi:hypothetical protein